MADQDITRSSGRQFSDRVDMLGWGLLFVALGTVSLTPSLPEGAWLVAAGLVLLGMSSARAWLRLPVWGVTVIVGIVTLAAGLFTVMGLATRVGPPVLVVLGMTLIVGAVYQARRQTQDAPRAAHTF